MNINAIGIVEMLLTGVTVAALPLAIVWTSNDVDKYRKLVWITLFLTFDLIVFGGFTRATDSGLGCPDWPGCYGHANPLQASAEIGAAQSAMPTGPVTEMKAWIEMIHRYFAGTVTMLIVAQLGIAWWRRREPANVMRYFLRPPIFLLGLIFVQIAFGAWTVTMKLKPVIVTTHLMLGLSLLAALAWFGARLGKQVTIANFTKSVRRLAEITLLLLIVQVALGGWVSTNYATLACAEFPTCQGSWLPQMNFSDGFTLWRDLGKTGEGQFLPFDALTAIHWVHRTFAFVVAACAVYLAFAAHRIEGLQGIARSLLIVLVAQIALGLSIIYFQIPLLLAVAHNAGAAALVVLLVMLNYRTRQANPPESASQHPCK